MVLAFDSTSKFGEAVFGSTSSQTAGSNGGIVQHNPSASAPVSMKGGRRQSRRRSQRQNQRRSQRQNQRRSQRQNGGNNKRRSQRRNQSKRQRGGK